jgi:soluble lytic murein transglycosylase-like protein
MKRLLSIVFLLLIAVACAGAQDHPRYYDNFETNSVVKINRETSQAAVDRQKTVSITSPIISKRLPSPAADRNLPPVRRRLVKKTAQVTMTVYEGYAHLEVPIRSPRPIDNGLLNMAAGKYLGVYSTGNSLIDSYIVESSGRYSIDPMLIYSQMSQESSFKPRALSNKGASGLMQLMPATARRMGVNNIYDPKQNIEGGVRYMRLLLDMFDGDVSLALAGYNAGEGAVMRYGRQIPPYNETQDYVRRISARYAAISNLTTRLHSPKTVGAMRPETITVRLNQCRAGLINK